MLKKSIKIILINIFIFCLMFFLLDYITICIPSHSLKIMRIKPNRVENKLPYDKNKKSVIVSGCSFAYGSGVYPNDNISYKLQEKTKRKVYNRGIPGWGPHSSLKDIQITSFFNKKKIIEPEYYIYVFISDHLRRIYIDYWDTEESKYVYNLYKIKNNRLLRRKNKITLLDHIQSIRLIRRLNRLAFDMTSEDKKFDRFKLYMYAIKKELKKRYPKTKVVILVYYPDADAKNTHHIKPFRTERWKELEDDGFIVIRFDSPEYKFLIDKEYLSPVDHVHPNGKAWDALVPVITKQLKL